MKSRDSDTNDAAGYDLRREFLAGNLFFRILFVVYLLIGGFGGLVGGYLLIHETRHWVPWSIAAIIVEPIGVACSVALLSLIAPDSIFATFLHSAIKRATFGAAVVGFALFSFITATLVYVAWYFMVTAR